MVGGPLAMAAADGRGRHPGFGRQYLAAAFIVYDWGKKREYDRLVELADLQAVNVIIDVTCGKLRGTQGLLSRLKHGHYFLIDIYDPEKMTDPALRRAREIAPLLQSNRRIYRRVAKPTVCPYPIIGLMSFIAASACMKCKIARIAKNCLRNSLASSNRTASCSSPSMGVIFLISSPLALAPSLSSPPSPGRSISRRLASAFNATSGGEVWFTYGLLNEISADRRASLFPDSAESLDSGER